jgi:hypothetical protein
MLTHKETVVSNGPGTWAWWVESQGHLMFTFVDCQMVLIREPLQKKTERKLN